MGFCLPKEFADKFLDALKDGTIDPAKLIDMSSAERVKFLEPIVGKDDVHEVNAQLESKLLLLDQKRGMVSWAKKVAGISETVRADLISRIEKMDKVLTPEDERSFLADLAAKKLGTEVTVEEARHIATLSKAVQESKANIADSEASRLKYGAARVALQNYVGELKLGNEPKFFKSLPETFRNNPIQGAKAVLDKAASFTKGIQASLDDSAIFRQGWKTVFTHPDIWMKNTIDSFKNIVKQIGRPATNNEVLDAVKADIQSRPNMVNGLYNRMKLDVGVNEEAFPTQLPEKIPLFGRLYKASETAYTAFLYRMRADIADKYVKIAENNGIDLTDDKQVREIGRMVNSLTGRGDLGSLEKVGKEINTIFFSPKLLKAQIDFLTGHNLDKDITPFVRKQAAINLVRTIAGTAAIMATAQAILGKNAVQTDPRSSDFGKIKIGDTRFDISGGAGSIITLAARLATLSTKSTTTGKITKLDQKDKKGNPAFGAETGMDVLYDFATNKTSPLASVIVDMLKQETFAGGKPTIPGEAANLITPLPISNAQEIYADPKGANPLLTIIADTLGINTNTFKK